VRLIQPTGSFRLGHIMFLQNELSIGRHFNVNTAELIVRDALNDFKKRLHQELSDTNNDLSFTLILLIY